ncbi:MAG TPA: DUF4202 family protein, partial [Minicystis sp.]|nr:DUF4202 family protein [Minicystis sp.]
AASLARAVPEVATRLQRFGRRLNAASRTPAFARAFARLRALHDLDKPLVLADYEHALDAWQWLLRLAPDAGLAAQLAMLFHDVERLASEADRRVEHLAADYRAFKEEHARRGGEMAANALADAGVDPETAARAASLVAGHERPGGDADRDLLNDADALSFFSLNADGFIRYYGEDHTRKKVAYTLARLRPRHRRHLARVRMHPSVAEMLAEHLGPATPAGEAA